MKLKPIQKKPVYQSIIEQIKVSIESKELKAGEKLPSERDLAAKLLVSRSAVREAFRVLESAGVVTILPGKGVFLTSDSSDEFIARMNGILDQNGINLIELLEVRQGIEGQAAYLAALRCTPFDLQVIHSAYQNLEIAVSSNNVAAEEDYEFHLSIVMASHNKTLLQAVKLFSDKFLQGLRTSRSESIKIPGKSEEVLKEHLEIYKAIELQDPVLAYKAMWKHLQNVKTRYL